MPADDPGVVALIMKGMQRKVVPRSDGEHLLCKGAAEEAGEVKRLLSLSVTADDGVY